MMATITQAPVDEAAEPVAEALPTSAVPAADSIEPVAAAKSTLLGLLPIIAVLLAAFAATVSVMGLIIASRTVAEARVAIESLRAGAPPAAIATVPPPVATSPRAVTTADLDRTITALRSDIARARMEQGGMERAATIGSAQAEIANRISAIGVKLDRIERALSASRGATRAGDRAPPS
jgi:hypothetical protein